MARVATILTRLLVEESGKLSGSARLHRGDAWDARGIANERRKRVMENEEGGIAKGRNA